MTALNETCLILYSCIDGCGVDIPGWLTHSACHTTCQVRQVTVNSGPLQAQIRVKHGEIGII